jgi:hypothetical protein
MIYLTDLGRRSFLTFAAALGGASTLGALPRLAGAEDTPQQTDTPAITLQDVPFSSGAKLTIERRGSSFLASIVLTSRTALRSIPPKPRLCPDWMPSLARSFTRETFRRDEKLKLKDEDYSITILSDACADLKASSA